MATVKIVSVKPNRNNPQSVRINFAGNKHLWVHAEVVNEMLREDRLDIGMFNDYCALGGYVLETPAPLVAHVAGDKYINRDGVEMEYAKPGFHCDVPEGEYYEIVKVGNPAITTIKSQANDNRVAHLVGVASVSTPTAVAPQESPVADDDMED